MPVEYTTGNLLNWPNGITVAAHCVSRQGVLGAGFGKALKEEFPSACEPYFAAFEDGKAPPLGSIIPAEVAGGKRLIHLVAQDKTGVGQRQVDYEALIYCLEQVHALLLKAHNEGRKWTLGIPKWLGAGLAGGSPRIIEAIVLEVFESSPVRCVVVALPTSQSA